MIMKRNCGLYTVIIVIIALLLMIASKASADSNSRPILVELFTSQGCSSCPPADRVLAELARDNKDVLALSFHVDYWDYIGWKDPFSKADFTARQKQYSRIMKLGRIYTPQIVIDGTYEAIGSRKNEVLSNLSKASINIINTPILVSKNNQDELVITINQAPNDYNANIMLVTYIDEKLTKIKQGENRDRSIRNINIVNNLMKIGDWQGAEIAFAIKPNIQANENIAIFLQDKLTGKIIGVKKL